MTVSTMHGINLTKFDLHTSKNLAFWDAMPRRQVHRYQRFGVTGSLHAQGGPGRVTWTFEHIHPSTRHLTRLVPSSASLQEPQIAHTHTYLFTFTNRAWLPSSHNLSVSLTDRSSTFWTYFSDHCRPSEYKFELYPITGLCYSNNNIYRTKSQRQ